MRRHALRTLPFELDPGPGLIAVDAPETVWRQARQLTGQGARPVAVLLTPDRGGQASATATRLVECGDGVLTQGPPW